MIRDSDKHLFDIVLVWKLDRFARNRYDSAHYKSILKKNGVRVVSATEHITDGPEGIMLESLLEGMAEYYSAELAEKIRRGQKENALKAQRNGGQVPFGYMQIDHKLQPDPATAPVALEIFKSYAEGATVREILEDLNQRGIKTRRGQEFKYSSFNRLLKNRTYIGEYHYSGTVISDGVPAIIPKEVFDRVQTRLEKNKRAPAMAKASDKFLLTTKLFCGKCGRMMVGESGRSHTGKAHYYYKCGSAKRKKGCNKKAVQKGWIEDFVVRQTLQMVMDDTLMNRLVDRLLELQGQESFDLQLLKKQLGETEKGIENMLNAIQAGIITTSTKERLASLEAQKAQLEESILKEQIKRPVLSREQITFFIHKFRKTDISDEDERQRLIDCFVNAVYVYDDKIVLTFNYKDGSKTVSLDEVNGSDLVVFGCQRQPENVIFRWDEM